MITFAFTFGPRVTVRSAQLQRMLRSREYLLFTAMSLLVMALLSPATHQETIPQLAAVWLCAGAVFHLALMGHVWVLSRVRPLSRLGYTPVAFTTSLICSELFNYLFRFKLLGLPFHDYPGILPRILQLLPIIVAIEQIFVRFLAPQLIDAPELRRIMLRHDRPGSPAFAEWPAAGPPSVAPPPPRPRIEIGGYTFDAQEIRLMIAEEHYTKVVTDSGAKLVRCKISAAVEQLPEDLGMRIHRSYWIAWSHAREVMKDAPGRFSVVAADGQRIPLSRDLRKAFDEQLADRATSPP